MVSLKQQALEDACAENELLEALGETCAGEKFGELLEETGAGKMLVSCWRKRFWRRLVLWMSCWRRR